MYHFLLRWRSKSHHGFSYGLRRCTANGTGFSKGSEVHFSIYRLFHFSPMLSNAALSILSLLRQRGPIPVSKISAELPDEALEEASESGGIAEVLKRRTDVVIVTLKKSVHVAVLKDMVQHVDRQHKQGVFFLLAAISALHNLPKIFSFRGAPLVPTIEALHRMAVGEGYSNLFNSPDAVHRTIHRYPTLFRIERGGRVRLTSLTDSSTVAGERQPDLVPSVTKVLTVKQEMLLSSLRKTVPESMYVSLKFWCSSSSGFWRSLQFQDLLSRLQELQSIDPPRIDVRQFGDGVEHYFVRILARQQDGFTVEEEEKKLVFDRQKKYFLLGREMIKCLEVYKSASSENYLSMIKGLTMNQIVEIIPSTLKEHILQLVYDEVDSSHNLDKNEAIILLFDRFRHIFDVRFSTGTIRLWSVLPPAEQPSTLTWETSPLPLVLRHALKELADRPQTPQCLFDSMPAILQWELQQLYPTTSGAKFTKNSSPENECIEEQVSAFNGAASMRLFSSHHSMFLFVAEDGLVYTPQLVASQKKKKFVNLSDSEKANVVFQLLPSAGAVDLMTFMGHDVGRELPFSPKTITETFVSRYPTFFRLYSPFASNRTVVGKVGAPPPPTDLLNPSFQCLEDLIKFIALHGIGGVTESTIMNNLSKEGRALIKRLGTPSEIAEQLPMWFDVRRDKFNSGASLITYIPGSAENSVRYPMLKLVSNDRSIDSNVDDAKEEWNEEWNE